MHYMHFKIKSFAINCMLGFCMKVKLCSMVSIVCSIVLRCIWWIKILDLVSLWWIFNFYLNRVSNPFNLFFVNIGIRFFKFVIHSDVRERITVQICSQINRTLITSISTFMKIDTPVCSILFVIIRCICVSKNSWSYIK
jgi:hypothetical protein